MQIDMALPMKVALDAAREAFECLAENPACLDVAPRMPLALGGGTCSVVAAALPEIGLLARLVSVSPSERERGRPAVSGLSIFADPDTGAPIAVFDGACLSTLRAAAASALATDRLARRNACVAAVLGCGRLARAHIMALTAVRSFDEIRIWGRNAEQVDKTIARLRGRIAPRLIAAASPAAAIDDADVVTTATGSTAPLFEGRGLTEHAHVNAIGGFRPGIREVDVETVASALVVVDHRATAISEAGDLMAAVAAGRSEPRDWIEFGTLLRRPHEFSTSRTLFKSVGLAIQDLFLARRALARERQSVGRAWV
ncbi:ornithine cyclodeaminase family protein [Nannocystaceae bacterium ST9]